MLNSFRASPIESLEARRLLATTVFTVDFDTLNADFGSTATGTATLTLNDDNPTMPSLRVQVDVTGLQDLSGITGAVHVAHIHGQFEGNRERPLPEQGDGTFFDGTGGIPVNSVVPTAADDGALNIDEIDQGLAENLYLDFFEGRPDYGPVVLNLASEQLPAPAEGVPPLTNFFNLAASGDINPAELFPSGTTFQLDTTYVFDLSDPDELRQFNNIAGPDGDQLDEREIVIHGLTIPTPISDAIDEATGAAPGDPTAGVPLGDGTSLRATAPVAAGEIEPAGDDGEFADGVFRAGPGGQDDVFLPTIYIEREAFYDNETGFFITDADGSVGGIAPGEEGYAEAALTSSTRQVIFESGSRVGALGTPTVAPDQNIVFYIIQDASTETFLAENPDNSLAPATELNGFDPEPLAFFSITEANPDGFSHLRIEETEGGLLEFRWEDLAGIGESGDFDDVVFAINVRDADDPTDEDVEGFAAVLTTLNDSGVTGVANIFRDGDSLTVTINAAGLVPNMLHPQHIHGRFESDPLTSAPRDSVTPTLEDDTDGDGFIEVLEGAPAYGPIILPLSSPPANDEAADPAATQSFPMAPMGVIRFSQMYDLSDESQFFDPINNLDFEGDDVLPLDLREIVLHGMIVPSGAGAGTGGEVNGTGGYKVVLPAAAGEIRQ